MVNTKELQSKFTELLGTLPEEAKAGISIQYEIETPLSGPIDVIIYRNDECMALGRFRSVIEKGTAGFPARYKLAMGFPEDCWYLFDYDGERMVLNDLTNDHPVDECPESAAAGLSHLLMHPEEWKNTQKKFRDMKSFVDALQKEVNKDRS